jgi:hypothetical protein
VNSCAIPRLSDSAGATDTRTDPFRPLRQRGHGRPELAQLQAERQPTVRSLDHRGLRGPHNPAFELIETLARCEVRLESPLPSVNTRAEAIAVVPVRGEKRGPAAVPIPVLLFRLDAHRRRWRRPGLPASRGTTASGA